MSILSNSKALALAALFRSGVVCAIGALPSGAAMQVPAHCAIVLHGLLCLPILIVIFVGSMR
ncbi:hypothetical protein BCEN4_1320034 [Burkholderia cenocepacia]|uniref:hypothetical protein n=1 Tax=Burkholderia cenocepacia TaxID=95486 RepID=UPI001A54DDE4|nr:hypothetical protein [Burkholderia cenocepacia]CAD9218774.1 hypothetical protein BCEN4_1320034 [Burkholderia cenocepacia]